MNYGAACAAAHEPPAADRVRRPWATRSSVHSSAFFFEVAKLREELQEAKADIEQLMHMLPDIVPELSGARRKIRQWGDARVDERRREPRAGWCRRKRNEDIHASLAADLILILLSRG